MMFLYSTASSTSVLATAVPVHSPQLLSPSICKCSSTSPPLQRLKSPAARPVPHPPAIPIPPRLRQPRASASHCHCTRKTPRASSPQPLHPCLIHDSCSPPSLLGSVNGIPRPEAACNSRTLPRKRDVHHCPDLPSHQGQNPVRCTCSSKREAACDFGR